MANRKIKAELEIDGKDNTSAAFRSVAKNVGNVEKRLAQFNKQAAAFNKTSAEFSKRAAAIDRAGAAVAQRHAAVGRASEGVAMAASRYLGPAALGAGFVYSVKQAANFEESLSNIQKKAGATGEQMQKMRGELMDLGHVMPVSMDEIAKGFERGAAAGIPLGELKEFAALSVKVADAWDVSAEESANFFSGFNASMHIKYGKEMKDYASLINDLGDSGIADEKDIADFIDRFGGSGINFGLTPQQIAAYGASMLDLKMPAEVGARAMNTLTSALLAPENLSKKAHKGLESIVGDVGKFSKLSGNDKLKVFIKDLAGMTGQRRTSLLGALLGTGFSDEIARLVAGSEVVAQNLALAERETKQASNSVDRVYEQRMALFNSQIKILQNNVNQVAVRLGDIVLPNANKALGFVNDQMADDDARQTATMGMTADQEHQQKLDYVKRWKALHPDEPFYKANFKAVSDYNDDLAKTGRGKISDVFDNISKQELNNFLDQKYSNWPDEASRQQTDRFSQPVVDHKYTTSRLPMTGPMPGPRPQPPVSNMAGQYAEYHAGQKAMREAQPLTPQGDKGDLAQTMDNLQKLEDSGQATWRAAGEDAGQKVADGGKEGAGYISQSAQELLSALRAGAASLSAAASDMAKAINAGKAGAAVGGMVNGGQPRDFDPGRSMPSGVTSPNAGQGSGGGGGGGF
ncbi:phage tail tape measure protein [Rhizobium tumorigenes]|uniref:phage tail tape measure protein n=1 Tax=Rhizobium tumorigenes TaxID=2041385 RepID=UPI00241CA27F|nr:phage tail tape measure protein [Rhizobium tumorigenes]WFS01590.1 phage tail tape measure protein [Rhizobium tumorigenes]